MVRVWVYYKVKVKLIVWVGVWVVNRIWATVLVRVRIRVRVRIKVWLG
jgi:hypothetical protein